MASLALSFEKIDNRLTFVSSGASVSRELSFVARTIVRMVVAVTLHRTIKLQESLVSSLHRGIGNMTAGEYDDIAHRLDSLTGELREVIAQTREYRFLFNHDSVRQMEEQCERLDSLAETYHMNADAETANYVSELMVTADTEAGTEGWREFVASLHD
jgi:hypothetical protein